jgi:polyphenol oxidase
MIEADDLRIAGVRHGFFGRQGGHSTGLYASLNCGLGSGDDRATVIRNRTIVARALGGEEPSLLTVHQVHSADAVPVTAPWTHEARPRADAMVTNVPGLILGSLTADCAPVLFVDPEARVVGVAHAGWKGALTGIMDQTVIQMEKLSATRANIRAVIGPTISQAAYEVGPEFFDRFTEAEPGNHQFFTKSVKNGHYMFDLPRYLLVRMRDFGVGHVTNTRICTYGNESEYFSFRRATHRGETDYGRQIAAITIS